jgi:protein subunit release factor A
MTPTSIGGSATMTTSSALRRFLVGLGIHATRRTSATRSRHINKATAMSRRFLRPRVGKN